ncbi:hypothetical protein [Litorimonas haliclonae]|uniref:hypothetical protein n=1 Tax=Litorimonas haliclonae TaxID=2081977 RepID=UPI0039F12642
MPAVPDLYSPHDNLHGEALIKEFRLTDNPDVAVLCRRLATFLDEDSDAEKEVSRIDEMLNEDGWDCVDDVISSLKEDQSAITEAGFDDLHELILAYQKKEQRALEADELETLSEEQVHEIDRLRAENKSFTETLTLMENAMLEEKIEKLIEALERNTAAHEKTAKMPPASSTKPKKEKAVEKAPAKTTVKEPDTSETEESENKLSDTDVKNRLIDYQELVGRDKAKELLTSFTKGGAAKFSALPESKYQDAFDACTEALKAAKKAS